MSLAVVMPLLNEVRILDGALADLRALEPRPQCVAVDGGSTDGTWERLGAAPDIIALQTPRGRAAQMNAGAAAATRPWLLFLHADTTVPQAAYAACLARLAAGDVAWGWFDVRFDDPRRAYRAHAALISLRARLFRTPTGDQALFVRRDLFQQVGGFPPVPLMEDVALARTLRARSRGVCLRPPVRTSARRWRAGGLLRTVVRMWNLKLQYLAGRDPGALARMYPDVR